MRIEDCKKRKCKYLGRAKDPKGNEHAWMCTHGAPDGMKPAKGWHPMDAQCSVTS